MRRHITVIWLLAGLAGCGGGGGGESDGAGIDPRLARLDVYEAQKLRVLGDPGMGVTGMPLTAPQDMPTSGSAMFEGSATIRVENGVTPVVLFGDAALTVDFDTQDGMGTLNNFFGNDTGGRILDYAGSIDLTAEVDQADLVLDYAGTLSAGGETLGFAGSMAGVFLGDPLGAFAAGDLEAAVDHSGTPRSATLVVIGEISDLP